MPTYCAVGVLLISISQAPGIGQKLRNVAMLIAGICFRAVLRGGVPVVMRVSMTGISSREAIGTLRRVQIRL